MPTRFKLKCPQCGGLFTYNTGNAWYKKGGKVYRYAPKRCNLCGVTMNKVPAEPKSKVKKVVKYY